MGKLNQIIAIEKGIKSKACSELSELYKLVQKSELFNGFSKTYQKKDEESEELPPEKKRVQLTAQDAFRQAERIITELMDVTARKDWSNCNAFADVKIEGKVVLSKVPVTYLLFLEKQITDIRTFINHIPVLDESEDWIKDENADLYKTLPTQTHRTKKIQKGIVLAAATVEHPAQTQLITEDTLAGWWNTIKQSGALPKPKKQEILGRVEKLLNAVKEAREEANSAEEIETPKIGEVVFGYILQI